jgi:hypothetical protein
MALEVLLEPAKKGPGEDIQITDQFFFAKEQASIVPTPATTTVRPESTR